MIGLTELIGLWAAAFPRAWLSLFGADPAMLDTGARYLRAVGPCYGLYGSGLALYFASVGAGRLLWPLLANLTRLVIAAVGGWLALRWGGDVSYVFLAQSAALTVFGLMHAGAVAGGAWSAPLAGRAGRRLGGTAQGCDQHRATGRHEEASHALQDLRAANRPARIGPHAGDRQLRRALAVPIPDYRRDAAATRPNEG